MSDDKIRGMPPKRDAASYEVQHDIVIPAGTILRTLGDGKFGCEVGVGLITVRGVFSVDMKEANGDTSTVLRRVVAS
jgi:hypothetical protein